MEMRRLVVSYQLLVDGWRWTIFIVLFLIFYLPSRAQSVNQLIRKGNKEYQQQNYTDAEASYKKALSKNKNSATGLFNLGNSMYAQKRYDDAYAQYEASAKSSKTEQAKEQANYNMGNTHMQNKDWEKSIAAYKKSLLLNPQDEDARYNLAYAQEMLKKNNNNKQNKNQKDKNNKQQNKNKNQDKNKNNKQDQNKDQQNKNNPNQQQDDQHPKPMPSKLTKQQAQQLLNALAQEERKLQDKADKNKKGMPAHVDKDW